MSCAGAALIFVVCASPTDHGWRLAMWGAAQIVATLANVAIYRRFRRGGELRGTTEGARAARRFGAALTGIAWGLGGVLWPLRPSLEPGARDRVLLRGHRRGGDDDPRRRSRGLRAPDVHGGPAGRAVRALGQWWMSALMSWFLAGTLFIGTRNGRTLRESLSLRFENASSSGARSPRTRRPSPRAARPSARPRRERASSRPRATTSGSRSKRSRSSSTYSRASRSARARSASASLGALGRNDRRAARDARRAPRHLAARRRARGVGAEGVLAQNLFARGGHGGAPRRGRSARYNPSRARPDSHGAGRSRPRRAESCTTSRRTP